jgi:succinate-acetate transporter protein
MSVESDVDQSPGLSEPAAAAPVGNPALLGLLTFLPSGISLGLWFVGYLPLTLPGGLIPIVTFSAGLFLLVATAWAARLGASAVAAIFGVFSAFWISFGFLVLALNNGLIAGSGDGGALTAADIGSIQAAYLLSFLLVFVLMTLITLRLPVTFTAGFVFVDITFALALAGVLTGNTLLFTLAGVTTFIFCAIFAYILADGMSQELGGRAYPLGNPIAK